MRNLNLTNIFFATILCFIVGLFFARFLLSIALTILPVIGLVQLIKNKKTNIIVLNHIFITIILGLSFFWSDDKTTFWNNYKNILIVPFVLLSFDSIQLLSEKQKQILFIVFNIAVNLSIIYSSYFLLLDATVVENYTKGQIVPTLIHHVGFSVLIVFNILLNLFWYWKANSSTIVIPENFVVERKNLSGIYLIKRFPIKLGMTIALTIINILFLHLLAVRSGLVLLYLSAFILGLYYIFKQKSIKKSVVAFLLLLLCSISCYYLFPSLKNKIGYALYDFQQSKNTTVNIDNLSDGRRLLSYKTATTLIKENIFFGVGLGDVQQTMKQAYQTKFGISNTSVYALPHNQYLFNFLSVGFVFGIIILFLYLLNLFYFIKHFKLYTIFYFLVLATMLWEPFLAYQLGISIYILSIFLIDLLYSSRLSVISRNEKYTKYK
ncbi:MAG: O-antigen ligase family protein [Chitinophagales bacterium]|nr:O-antigen ligase family protein [Chitinophagales bacterium]